MRRSTAILCFGLASCLLFGGCGASEQSEENREISRMRETVVGLWIGLEDVIGPGARFEGKWPQFVSWAEGKGFTALAIPVVRSTADPEVEPTIYLDVTFADNTKLSDLGYPLSEAYSLKSLIIGAHERGLRFYADLSQFGRIASAEGLGLGQLKGQPLDAEKVAAVAKAVLDLGADGIVGQHFPRDWADAVANAARAAGAVYVSADPERELGVPGEYFEAQNLLIPELSPQQAARADYYYAAARGANKPAWMLASCDLPQDLADDQFGASWASVQEMANAMLFRAAQSRPDGFFIRQTLRGADALPDDLFTRLADYASVPDDRPVLNLIVDAAEGWRERIGAQFDASLEAIINAAGAAGYRLLATAAPSPEAAAYYIYAEGSADETGHDLSAETLGLLSGDKAVFLQVATTIPPHGKMPGWDAAREAFGLGTDDIQRLTEMPSGARYRTKSYTCLPEGGAPGSALQAFLALPANLDGVQVLAETEGKERRYAMVTIRASESGAKRIFVNGAALNREAALPLCAALSDQGLQDQTRALCTLGTLSMFFAADSETTIAAELPNGQRLRERLERSALKVIDARAGEQIAHKRAELAPPEKAEGVQQPAAPEPPPPPAESSSESATPAD